MTTADKNLEVLAKMLEALDTQSTMDEFLQAFELVVKYVEQIKQGNDDDRAVLLATIEDSIAKKGKELARLQSKTSLEMEARFRELSANVRDGLDGKDGLQGPPGPPGASVKGDKGDSGIPGKDGSPDTPNEIIAKVNEAQDLINPEKIKGLKDIERIAKANAFDPTMGPSFADLKKLQDQITNNTNSIATSKVAINFIIDGGGSAITTGIKGFVEIPYGMTVTGWQIFGDQSGSIVIDVWKDTYANFPPSVADTITGTEKPTLSSQQNNQDLSLSTWTTALSQGDILAYNVDSVSTVTRITVTILGTKN